MFTVGSETPPAVSSRKETESPLKEKDEPQIISKPSMASVTNGYHSESNLCNINIGIDHNEQL